MKTNTVYTNNILNGYADAAGLIDIDYIAHCVEIVADNDRKTSELKLNTRRAARNVAIDWLMYWIKTELEYNHGREYYATNNQVIAWDRSHGGQLEKVLDLVEKYIVEERNENY